MYYGARWYDVALGRFVQADTIIPEQTQGTQAWDRYAGMNNNPVRYNDPTGHIGEDCGDNPETCKDISTQPEPPLPPLPCPTLYSPDCHPTPPDKIGPVVPSNDFVSPFEFDKLDAIGIRVDVGGWIPVFPVLGGGISFDIVFNSASEEISINATPNIYAGLGEGGSLAVGPLFIYDAPDNDALAGLGYGAQANVTAGGGLQIGYSYSDRPGWTGKHAQIYSILFSGGAELSASAVIGYTIPIFTFNAP